MVLNVSRYHLIGLKFKECSLFVMDLGVWLSFSPVCFPSVRIASPG